MKIKYVPDDERMHNPLIKYGIRFEKGKTTEVKDEALAEKLLNCPYFEKPKAGRPRVTHESTSSNKSS